MKTSRFFEITRRELMVAAPAVAAAAGLGTMGRAALAGCVGHGERQAAKLSLAYLQGSEAWDYLQGLTPTLRAVAEDMEVDEAPLVPAEFMISGDPSFARRGARVTVHGPLSAETDRLPAMVMKAHFRPYHEAVHAAWGYQGTVLSRAQPATAFTVPIDAVTGLRLSLEIGPALAEAHFDPGDAPGRAKLRRGAYLMSWSLPSGTADPGWRRYRVIAERIERPEEGMPEIRRFMIADAAGQAKSLPAVMLTVDHAEGAAV